MQRVQGVQAVRPTGQQENATRGASDRDPSISEHRESPRPRRLEPLVQSDRLPAKSCRCRCFREGTAACARAPRPTPASESAHLAVQSARRAIADQNTRQIRAPSRAIPLRRALALERIVHA